MLNKIISLLRINDDDLEHRFDNHMTNKSKKVFLELVKDIHFEILNSLNHRLDNNVVIEIGAGVIPIKDNAPFVRSTDIENFENLDAVLDATNMDVPNETVDAFLLQNTFHHINNPERFFNECVRTLKPGGRIVIVDPYWNFVSRLIYKKLFTTESYDQNGLWERASNDSMLDANQALSYIVFVRDLEKFERKFPKLKIINISHLKFGLRYLLSGGLNFRQIAPGLLFKIIKILEKHIAMKYPALHCLIVIEKQ